MKLTCLTFALALLSATSLFSGEASTPRVIQVNGSATVSAEPDLMRWNLELVTSGDDAAKVTSEHAALLKETLRYIDSLDLPKDAVQASQLRINDETSYVESKLRQKDIVARINVMFTTTAMDQYRDIWIDLGKLKGVRISHVEMDSSRRSELEKEARAKALQAGKAKAEAMAGVLGATLKEPIAIREAGMQPFEGANVRFKAMSADAGGQPLPGSIEISESADLTFRIE